MVTQGEAGSLDSAPLTVEPGIMVGDSPPAWQRSAFNGQIDELMVFERVLRGQQIVELRNWAMAPRASVTASGVPATTTVKSVCFIFFQN